MDGRSSNYTDMDRNTSEELFIRTLMESSVGMPAPTMEMMGFKNLPHNNFRTDSEELFKSWLTNGENHGPNPGSIVHHRPRQASRRIHTDLSSFSGHQNGASDQRKQSNEEFLPQTSLMNDESSIGVHDRALRNAAEKGIQASNLYLAKAWFHSSQPMTRSRSSELRRRYAAMQNSQTAIGMEAMHNVSCHTVNHLKQEFVNPSGFNDASLCEIPKQLNVFMSPPNSSSSTLNDTQGGTADKISSVVSMLKGTLERKKLSNQSETKAIEESSSQYFGVQGIFGDSNLDRGQEIHIHEAHGNFQELSTGVQGVFEDSNLNRGQGIHIHDTHGSFQELLTAEVKVPRLHQMVEETINMDLECFVSPMHGIQMNNVSREPSVSESSAAAPIASTVFDTCDAPSNSCQTLSICESSMKNVGSERSSEKGFGVKDVRGQMYGTVKDERKQKGGLVRYGSVNSAGSADKGDPTKKRRVERSRKMAEAKERNLTPAIPSDMQSVLKRCENLEKEVRSLKLNLAFMNRKDSEQTKQIEELQKQNEELGDEKERLLEEIERIISENGKM